MQIVIGATVLSYASRNKKWKYFIWELSPGLIEELTGKWDDNVLQRLYHQPGVLELSMITIPHIKVAASLCFVLCPPALPSRQS